MTSYDLTDGKEPVSWAEIDYLKELAVGLPPNPLIVNIGAATGVSTCAFLETRPDALIYSIDVDSCEQEFANARACGLDATRILRLLGDSKEFGSHFPLRCDLLFVDGDHWNAAGDIEAWVKTGRVKAGGVVALHDYQEVCAPNNPGSVYSDVQASCLMSYEKLGEVERVIAFRMPE